MSNPHTGTHFQLWNVVMGFWSCQQSKLVFSCFKIPLQGLSTSNRDSGGFPELRAAPRAPVGGCGLEQHHEEREENP